MAICRMNLSVRTLRRPGRDGVLELLILEGDLEKEPGEPLCRSDADDRSAHAGRSAAKNDLTGRRVIRTLYI